MALLKSAQRYTRGHSRQLQQAASEATTTKINSQIDMSVRLRVFGANEKLYIFFSVILLK